MISLKQILSIFLVVLVSLSCSKEEGAVSPRNLTVAKWNAMSKERKAAAFTQYGHILKIEIANINLQKVSTGVTKLFPSYVYNYATPVKLFESDADDNLYVEAYPSGPVVNPSIGEATGPNVNSLYLNISGTVFEATIDVNGMILIPGGIQYTVNILPPASVGGVSANYSVLIDALNSAGSSSVARPNLPIPADLKVLSFGAIKLTIVELD